MTPFVSYSQNREDVVLWRALSGVVDGRYVDVGANDPSYYSVTRAFYDHGWSGLCVEPDPEFIRAFQSERPRDRALAGVISDSPESRVLFHYIPDTGLSTLIDEVAKAHQARGFAVEDIEVASYTLSNAVAQANLGADVHFLVVDTEGAEYQVLRSADFERFRPWIIVVEATEPLTTTPSHASWEPMLLDAGYVFCLFDGLSRFYVDARNHAELIPPLSYPVCVFDDFVEWYGPARELEARLADSEARLADSEARIVELEDELGAVLSTVSWRLTRPLRSIQALRHRPRPTDASR